MALLDKIKLLTAKVLQVDASDVCPEASIVNDLDADSLDLIELVTSLEEEFEIDIPDDVVERLVTIQDVVAFIESDGKKTRKDGETNGYGSFFSSPAFAAL